jgi:hypothetical protein
MQAAYVKRCPSGRSGDTTIMIIIIMFMVTVYRP